MIWKQGVVSASSINHFFFVKFEYPKCLVISLHILQSLEEPKYSDPGILNKEHLHLCCTFSEPL